MTETQAPAKMFILFDGRAKLGDTDDATVLDTADSEEEAVQASKTVHRRVDAIWFEYDLKPGTKAEYANETNRFDLGRKWLL